MAGITGDTFPNCSSNRQGPYCVRAAGQRRHAWYWGLLWATPEIPHVVALALPFLSFLKQCAAPPWHGTSYAYGELGVLSLLPSPRPSSCDPPNAVERQMSDRKQSGGDNRLDRPALQCVALLRRKMVRMERRLA